MQEIFNKVVTHLRTQKFRSVDFAGQCVYKAENGKMCAVGCLLGDKYNPAMEYQDITDPIFEGFWTEEETDLLIVLQNTHDYYPIEKWESQFPKIANMFGLTMPN